MTTSRETRCTFVPPWLLERLGAEATLASDAALRARRERVAAARTAGGWSVEPAGPAAARPAWTVHSAGNAEVLPGEPVRLPGTPASGDPAVDEAAAGITATLEMWAE